MRFEQLRLLFYLENFSIQVGLLKVGNVWLHKRRLADGVDGSGQRCFTLTFR